MPSSWVKKVCTGVLHRFTHIPAHLLSAKYLHIGGRLDPYCMNANMDSNLTNHISVCVPQCPCLSETTKCYSSDESQ